MSARVTLPGATASRDVVMIPLFPLQAVLFPDGILPLRVFEVRYVDMVRECLRESRPFGVCLIAQGQEVGGTAVPEAIGCLAQIDGWEMQQLGVLHIRARGQERFLTQSTQRQSDGLLRAEIEPIEPDEDAPIPADYAPCVALLARVIDDLATQARTEESPDASAAAAHGFAQPHRLDSSVWVGNRLCEILPIPLRAKQKLMELQSAQARLDILLKYLRQHAIIR